MAEFHKNQIAWQAPEAQKVSLVKPDHGPLAEAFGNLGRMADNVAKSEMGYLDNQIVSELDAITAEMNQKLSEADSLDADYSGIVAEAMAKWDAAFSSYDAATQRRFTNNNPNAREAFQLDIGARALKKEQDQIYNRSKLDIAQWSTDVVTAPAEMQDAVLRDRIAAIQNLGLPISQTDDLVFRLRSEIDDYSIANAISNGDFARAKDLLENGLPTKGASERAGWWKQLQNEIKTESREQAEKQKLLEEAKEKGQDYATQYLFKEMGRLVELDQVDAARDLMEDYFYGKTIKMTNEKGEVDGLIYTSQSPLSLRSKIYNQMETILKNAPSYKKYISDYRLDYSRLSTGLSDEHGNLNLADDEYVTPEQYALAKSLYDRHDGWESLSPEQRDFVNRVMRSYGNEDALYMMDLNPNSTILRTNWRGMDYIEKNPVVNFNAMMNTMSNFAPTEETNKQLAANDSNYFANIIEYYGSDYKKKKFTNKYKIQRGSRADALANLFVITATKNNPLGMSEMGMTNVPRTTFEESFVTQMIKLNKTGEYNVNASYNALLSDFNDVYKRLTGHELPKENEAALSRYATIAYQAAIKKPDSSLAKSIHEQPLVSPVGEQRYIADVLDAQRPQKRLKDQTHEVTTYKVPSDIETVEEHEERVEKIKEEIKREEEKKKQPTRRERTNYENAQQALGLDLEGLSVYANEEERQKHIAATKKIIEDFEAKYGGYTVVPTTKKRSKIWTKRS